MAGEELPAQLADLANAWAAMATELRNVATRSLGDTGAQIVMARPSPEQPNLTVADELQRAIADLTERIERQVKRIQRIKVTRAGSSHDLETVLAEMTARRNAMHAELTNFEAGTTPDDRSPTPSGVKLTVVPTPPGGAQGRRVVNKGWQIDLSRGIVRLRRMQPTR